ncbi:unnamed protein product [Prunus armeniaca]|uniref:SRP54-type proteins GTP-binding domain-containing protein n=1 Tax=Prunus armeniaca TaxID=36596 RepID=A0A6J5VLZ1_PRUAR|nr:unnamed protein product [Prunus armeniaca]
MAGLHSEVPPDTGVPQGAPSHLMIFVCSKLQIHNRHNSTLVTTFNLEIGITGAILTKLDGDSRGGATLSVKEIVNDELVKLMGGEVFELDDDDGGDDDDDDGDDDHDDDGGDDDHDDDGDDDDDHDDDRGDHDYDDDGGDHDHDDDDGGGDHDDDEDEVGGGLVKMTYHEQLGEERYATKTTAVISSKGSDVSDGFTWIRVHQTWYKGYEGKDNTTWHF